MAALSSGCKPRIAVRRLYYYQTVSADQYWDGNGPIFFYTGNEGPITGFWDNSGFVFEAAKEFSALVIFGEHVS